MSSRLLTLLGDQRLTIPALRELLAALGVVEWYYPGDLASMATTYTGVTPPTVGGSDTVGRMYGQSQGYALGAELVSYGDFSNGTTTGWTPLNSTLSVVDGRFAVTITSGTYGLAYRDISSSINAFYLVSGEMYPITATAVIAPGDVQRATNALLRVILRANGSVGGVAQFDNISVRKILGYHSGAVLDSARPRLLQSGAVKYLFRTSGQALTAYLPASVGATCTVVYVPPAGDPVTVPGVLVTSQAVTLAYNACALAILPSSASAEQIASVASILAPLAYRSAA